MAERFTSGEWINLDGGAAALTVRSKVVQAFKSSALTLPVPDLILDKIKCGSTPKIRYGEYRLKHGLQARGFALFRQEIHLEKPVVRFSLNLNQVRDSDRGCDLRKIHTLRRLAGASS
jgi:hypothetical protein